ncbi:conjugal transfer protein TraW [Sandaracinobacter sp. RS1-74]|uniref:conjugal transfer protein TraW n=1 Tax=Sandaracinobacteroides sayramensis TaxID=2913411 RepID=UPI001EDBFCC0|nr:conjugal transfer protein TraW [Sandaracinobacteroides sayramensis]MCG2841310.1 conjugal transfer protein TraW [Sandaracinobacteroides sayramensis]
MAGDDPRGWRVVAFQSALIAGLVAGALLVAAAAHAETSTIGRTWPIAEPDAMTEIEGRAANQPPNMAAAFGPRSEWSALKAAPLGVAERDRVRSVVPFYTLDFDITLPDGKILYPKGFSFNPLSFVSLPQRLVIVHPRDLGWAMRTTALTDWILLTDGGGRSEDALSLGEKHGRALFILEERVKERLGLTVAPVIVRQVGQRLELTEVRLDRALSRKANP